jgi:CheY-like chemotaxis protein
VVWNLVSNAVKFTEAGGEVRVELAKVGSTIRIVVRDTGKGIAREHLKTIFERFRQVETSTTRQHGGLGLGLAIVRYLVEAHGGVVEAHSGGIGHGASFVVTLPAVTAALAIGEPGGALALGEHRPLRGARVLLVDDDDDAREVLGDALVESGAIVERAASAAEAFASLLREAPGVIISDIGMPGEDGFSLLARIRALPPEKGGDVPAIALTAYARAEDITKTEEAGFQIHLVKPVRFEQLVEAVRSFVAP